MIKSPQSPLGRRRTKDERKNPRKSLFQDQLIRKNQALPNKVLQIPTTKSEVLGKAIRTLATTPTPAKSGHRTPRIHTRPPYQLSSPLLLGLRRRLKSYSILPFLRKKGKRTTRYAIFTELNLLRNKYHFFGVRFIFVLTTIANTAFVASTIGSNLCAVRKVRWKRPYRGLWNRSCS